MPDPRMTPPSYATPQAGQQSPFYTDQQWLQLLESGDLDSTEKMIAAQRALAKELRGAKDSGRMDWGSQVGRGLSGIAGAITDYDAAKGMQQYKKEKQDWMNRIRQQYEQRQAQSAPAPVAQPNVISSPAPDYTGFGE